MRIDENAKAGRARFPDEVSLACDNDVVEMWRELGWLT